MSFGFSTGDIIAVGDLAWRLYRDCYKVARGAPQEFQMLEREISTLSNSLNILQEEVKDQGSVLVRAGEDRVRMVNEMISGIGDTLKGLEKVAKKYQILRSDSKSKKIWAKFKWSTELRTIDRLRSKLVYHNTVMNLLLTSVGNSSLQRIESSNALLQNDLKSIKDLIMTSQSKNKTPIFSMGEDEISKTSLSAGFMSGAEINQPWSTIGMDEWIEAGRWWLLRSQIELRALTENQEVSLEAYTNLMKASWILIDVIACHPQFSFLTAARHTDVQALSTEVKNELVRIDQLGLMVPKARDIEVQELKIWETVKRTLFSGSTKEINEHDIFQTFGKCELSVASEPSPCRVLFLAHDSAKAARLLAQDQKGDLIMNIDLRKAVNYNACACGVEINGNKITFCTTKDAQRLLCLVEAAIFYLRDCGAEDSNLRHLIAYALLASVKNGFLKVKSYFLTKEPPKEECTGIISIAKAIASQQTPQFHKILPEKLTDWRILRIEEEVHRVSASLNQFNYSLAEWAIICGLAELVEHMITEDQLDLETVNSIWTLRPVDIAILYGHEALLRVFCKPKMHPSWKMSGFTKASPLHIATLLGHETITKILCTEMQDLVHSKDISGSTPLHEAARNSNKNIISNIIHAGADLNAEDDNRDTPLMEAANHGVETAIDLLLEHGALISSKNARGLTAADIAILSGKCSFSTIKRLLDENLVQRKLAADNPRSLNETHVIVFVYASNIVKFILNGTESHRISLQTSPRHLTVDGSSFVEGQIEDADASDDQDDHGVNNENLG